MVFVPPVEALTCEVLAHVCPMQAHVVYAPMKLWHLGVLGKEIAMIRNGMSITEQSSLITMTLFHCQPKLLSTMMQEEDRAHKAISRRRMSQRLASFNYELPPAARILPIPFHSLHNCVQSLCPRVRRPHLLGLQAPLLNNKQTMILAKIKCWVPQFARNHMQTGHNDEHVDMF